IEAQRERLQPLQEQLSALNYQADQAFQQALYQASLKTFAIRLLFVLPLLIAAIWLFRRHRNSQHWPFAWGFIFFALFAFFFELVPYLPSFGGYIRYGVGAILTFLGGKALMRALQQY
ncbi:serine endopeptidase, partial [Undibacterium sp. LFS511W]|nr:serine endopeptidase [Undibacterium luofuense]